MSSYSIEVKVIGFKTLYEIYDENDIYLKVTSKGIKIFIDRILGSIFSIGQKFSIQDIEENEYLEIRKRRGFIREKYDILYKNKKIWEIRRIIKSMEPKFIILMGKEIYEINGDIVGKNFIVRKDCMRIGTISKKRFKIQDRYNIQISRKKYEKLIIASTICIDSSIYN